MADHRDVALVFTSAGRRFAPAGHPTGVRHFLTVKATMIGAEKHLGNLDLLRGIAALAVCVFHFSGGGFLGNGAIESILQQGYLGVDAFFVISGFVIPLALYKAGFSYRRLPLFLLGRFLRLYPAYLGAALLSVGLWYASSRIPGFQGAAPHFSTHQLLCNLTLSCDLLGASWLIPVFWTLAIEAQYYILVGLAFPWLVRKEPRAAFLGGLLWISLPMLCPIRATVFSYCALFGLGIVLFLKSRSLLKTFDAVVLFVLALLVQCVAGGIASAITALLSVLFIIFTQNMTSNLGIAAGTVSYSIYLLHVPVGGRVINFCRRLPETFLYRGSALLLALALSVGFACLYYYFVEGPSHRFSRKITRSGERAKASSG